MKGLLVFICVFFALFLLSFVSAKSFKPFSDEFTFKRNFVARDDLGYDSIFAEGKEAFKGGFS